MPLVNGCLLGLTTKVEVGKYAPLLKRLQVHDNVVLDPFGGAKQIMPAGSV